MSGIGTKPEEKTAAAETDAPATQYEVDFRDDKIKPWKQCTPAEKAKLVMIVLIKICFILGAAAR